MTDRELIEHLRNGCYVPSPEECAHIDTIMRQAADALEAATAEKAAIRAATLEQVREMLVAKNNANSGAYANAIYEVDRIRALTTADDAAWLAKVKYEAREECAKIADGYHERACEWAEKRGIRLHNDTTDSSRIAADIRASKEGK